MMKYINILIAFLLIIGLFVFTIYTFFGLMTLAGLIIMIESIPPLKWIVMRTANIVDVFIFIFSIIAMAQFGVTISAGLTVVGLGYTAFYKPLLVKELNEKQKTYNRGHSGYIIKF